MQSTSARTGTPRRTRTRAIAIRSRCAGGANLSFAPRAEVRLLTRWPREEDALAGEQSVREGEDATRSSAGERSGRADPRRQGHRAVPSRFRPPPVASRRVGRRNRGRRGRRRRVEIASCDCAPRCRTTRLEHEVFAALATRCANVLLALGGGVAARSARIVAASRSLRFASASGSATGEPAGRSRASCSVR